MASLFRSHRHAAGFALALLVIGVAQSAYLVSGGAFTGQLDFGRLFFNIWQPREQVAQPQAQGNDAQQPGYNLRQNSYPIQTAPDSSYPAATEYAPAYQQEYDPWRESDPWTSNPWQQMSPAAPETQRWSEPAQQGAPPGTADAPAGNPESPTNAAGGPPPTRGLPPGGPPAPGGRCAEIDRLIAAKQAEAQKLVTEIQTLQQEKERSCSQSQPPSEPQERPECEGLRGNYHAMMESLVNDCSANLDQTVQDWTAGLPECALPTWPIYQCGLTYASSVPPSRPNRPYSPPPGQSRECTNHVAQYLRTIELQFNQCVRRLDESRRNWFHNLENNGCKLPDRPQYFCRTINPG